MREFAFQYVSAFLTPLESAGFLKRSLQLKKLFLVGSSSLVSTSIEAKQVLITFIEDLQQVVFQPEWPGTNISYICIFDSYFSGRIDLDAGFNALEQSY